MINGFIAKKAEMTSVYLPDGKRIAVTRLLCPPLTVTQIKEQKKDGYQAIQVAYGQKKSLDKPTTSKLAKLKLNLKPQFFKEFAPVGETLPEIGSNITFDTVFAVGDTISITGQSKGHGFAGVIKRYGFHRQPVTGGQSDRVRAPGSIGAQTPGKVVRGKKMPGHYGAVFKTVSHLKIFDLNKDKNELLVSGSIPGARNSWVIISKT